MAGQEFQTLVETGLLRQVETVVVEAHRNLYLSEAREWSPPLAYRWLRYEDPMPVERLLEGTKRLRRRGLNSTATLWRKPARKRQRGAF